MASVQWQDSMADQKEAIQLSSRMARKKKVTQFSGRTAWLGRRR